MLLAVFCACTAQFVSDLFGNHIVGFPTRWLKFKVYLCQKQSGTVKEIALFDFFRSQISCFETLFILNKIIFVQGNLNQDHIEKLDKAVVGLRKDEVENIQGDDLANALDNMKDTIGEVMTDMDDTTINAMVEKVLHTKSNYQCDEFH